MKISVVIPVYNEVTTIEEIISRILTVPLNKEIIVVDDCSTDGTRERLKRIKRDNHKSVKIITHSRNRGKGAALRTGFEYVTGDIAIIQDADLEYDPQDYPRLLRPILENKADVVYGSRFLGGPHRVFFFWHMIGNKFLTFITNLLYNTTLTDMETCYKVFRSNIIKNIKCRSNGFSIEPELTAKVFKQKVRVYEIPISYYGRTYEEGKKITWRMGFSAIWALLKYRFVD